MPVKLNLPWSGSSFKLRDNNLHTSLYCPITVLIRRLLWTTWQSSTYEPLLYYHCRGQEAPLNYLTIIYIRASIVLSLSWSGGSFELRDNNLHTSLYCTITVVVRRRLWTTWQSSTYEPLLYYHCRGQEAPLNYLTIIYIRASIVLSLSLSGGSFELRDNHLHTSLYCTITVVVRRRLWTTCQSSTYEPLLCYHCRCQEAPLNYVTIIYIRASIVLSLSWSGGCLNYVTIIYIRASLVLSLPLPGSSFELRGNHLHASFYCTTTAVVRRLRWLRDNHLHASLYCTITVVVRRLLWTTWQSSTYEPLLYYHCRGQEAPLNYVTIILIRASIVLSLSWSGGYLNYVTIIYIRASIVLSLPWSGESFGLRDNHLHTSLYCTITDVVRRLLWTTCQSSTYETLLYYHCRVQKAPLNYVTIIYIRASIVLSLSWSGGSFELRDNHLHTSLYCTITVVVRRHLWTTWQSSTYDTLWYYHCRGQEAPLNYATIIYIRYSIVLSLSWSGGSFELRDNHLHTSLYCAITGQEAITHG